MLLAIDVYYKNNVAKAVGVLFEWDDDEPKKVITENMIGVEDYQPGEFYKRELPALLKIIQHVELSTLSAIVVDGYVYTDNDGSLGLGGVLYEKLKRSVPIIGVAKTSFFNNKQMVMEVLRGESKNPLYVSAVGFPLEKACDHIKQMKGDYRIPTILKELDKITKRGDI